MTDPQNIIITIIIIFIFIIFLSTLGSKVPEG